MVESIQSSDRIVSSAVLERPIRVLHVDDDPAFSKVAKQCLDTQGEFEVETASSVNEALEKLKKKDYDAIVSDYQMPNGKDGLQFLKELREKGDSIPFIIFTGKGREEIAIKALNLGADGYFNKSGHPETVYGELAHGIRQVVGKRRAEQSFLKSEDKYRRLVETLHEGIWAIDKDSRTTFVNPRMAEMLGYDIEEMKGRPLFSFMDERGVEIAKRLLERRKQGIKEQHDFEFLRKDGTRIYVTLETAPITDDNGKYIGALASVMDMTERKKAEEEKSRLLHDLRESLKELNCFYGMSRLFEKSDISLDDVFQKAADLLPPAMQYPDIACARIVVENREFSTKNFKDTRWKLQAEIEISGKKVGSVEVRYLEERPTIAGGPFLREERLLIDAVAERLGKITERKKAEQASKESGERLRSIVESSSDQIFMLDRDCRFLSVNKTGADLFRMSPQEMVGRSISEKFPEAIAAQFSKNIKNILDTGKSMQLDEKMVVEGRELYNSTSLNPVRDDSGRVIAVTGIVRDITDRKKIEKMLQESEERFRAIFEGANDGILVADVKTKRFFFANPRICEITGYSSEELLKLGVGDIHPKKDLPHVIDSFTKLVQGKLTLAKDLPVLRKDERVVYCDVSARSVKIGSQEYLIGLFRDVTERKKTEQTLRASLERYRSFIEVTGEVGWTTNPEGEVVEDTPSFRKFTGQTYEEIKGGGWSKALHPDDIERVTQIWKEATRTKSKYETEYRMRRHDGVYRYFMARSVPVLNEDGSIREWVGTCIDITDLKDVQEHLKETNKKLEATNEKLHVVGSLTRHDVNNKLSAVTGYAYLLKKKHADQADIVEGLGKMEQAVREVGKIFDFAKIYEQLGVEELTHVDVEKTLDEAAALFFGLTIKVVNGCHGLTVLADSFLRQLFYNLIDNTRRYGGKATTVRVYCEKAESGELRLVYEDDGVGISAENKLKLFTEGFSTGGSTGFGLFLIRKMMDVYGWQIQETGELGKGAKFVITMPKANLNGKENYQLS